MNITDLVRDVHFVLVLRHFLSKIQLIHQTASKISQIGLIFLNDQTLFIVAITE